MHLAPQPAFARSHWKHRLRHQRSMRPQRPWELSPAKWKKVACAASCQHLAFANLNCFTPLGAADRLSLKLATVARVPDCLMAYQGKAEGMFSLFISQSLAVAMSLTLRLILGLLLRMRSLNSISTFARSLKIQRRFRASQRR